jgi:hypothetical protein
MTASTPELVERLYRKLVDALAETTAVSPSALTIADLYQHLIPYRAVRGELGVLELAQYEHALLRLLAGEGGLVRVLDEEARRELAAELGSPNPILGVYRDYAGVGVELRDAPQRASRSGTEESSTPPARPTPRPGAMPPPGGAPADAVRVARTERVPEPQPLTRPESRAGAPPERRSEPQAPARPEPRPAPPASAEAAAEASPPPQLYAESDRVAASFPRPTHRDRPAARSAPAPGRATRCVSCREALPDADGLRFCPHCGADQSAVACERCGTPIQRGWKFCIRCGARSPTSRP